MDITLCAVCQKTIEAEDDVVLLEGEQVHRRCAPNQLRSTGSQNPLFRD